MITAVDSNVLIDVYQRDPRFVGPSGDALRRCLIEGRVVACDVVWAEATARFPSEESAVDAMRRLGIEFSELDAGSAIRAGQTWHSYRGIGGSRARVIADFIVGAHALLQADRLLTRDRGFYRTYFSDLEILDPSTDI